MKNKIKDSSLFEEKVVKSQKAYGKGNHFAYSPRWIMTQN